MSALPLSVDTLARLLNELLMMPELHLDTFPNDECYETFIKNLIEAVETTFGIKLDHITKHSTNTTLCEVTEYCLWLNPTSSYTKNILHNYSIQSNAQYKDLIEDSLAQLSAKAEN